MEWIWIFSLCMYVESCNNTYVSVKNDVTEVRKENFIRGKLIWIGLHLYVHIFGEGQESLETEISQACDFQSDDDTGCYD